MGFIQSAFKSTSPQNMLFEVWTGWFVERLMTSESYNCLIFYSDSSYICRGQAGDCRSGSYLMSRRPSGRPRKSSRESPGVQVLPSPDHPTPTPALPFPLSIHFNFWASDQIMKPRLIKQHGAKQMGPLVTARKIAPPTQITVESVLMTRAAVQFLLLTQLIALD